MNHWMGFVKYVLKFLWSIVWPTRRKPVDESAIKAVVDARWQSYQDWCDSRVCLGGCGKKAKDRPRDHTNVARDQWITEECCWDCWAAGRSTGRSAESAQVAAWLNAQLIR